MPNTLAMIGAGRVGRALGRRLREAGWRIGAVVTRSEASDHIQSLVKGLGATYPMVASGAKNFDAFGVETVPAVFLIDEDGTVLASELWRIEKALEEKFAGGAV